MRAPHERATRTAETQQRTGSLNRLIQRTVRGAQVRGRATWDNARIPTTTERSAMILLGETNEDSRALNAAAGGTPCVVQLFPIMIQSSPCCQLLWLHNDRHDRVHVLQPNVAHAVVKLRGHEVILALAVCHAPQQIREQVIVPATPSGRAR